MAAPTSIVIDQWSPLSYKAAVGQPGDQRAPAVLAPTWVPDRERRRLNAYVVRAAMASNVGRLTVSGITDAERDERAEYGDPHTFIDRVANAVLGDGWDLVVDGADEDLADGPRLPDRPEPYTGNDPLAKRIAKGKLEAWTRQALAAIDEWETALAAQPDAQARQDALREWAESASVQLQAIMWEAQHMGGRLGESIVVLWPRAGDWPRPEVYDPGAYFPDLSDVVRGEFPGGINLCWEFERDVIEGGTVVTKTFLRKMTWAIVDITAEAIVVGQRGAIAWRGEDGQPLPEGSGPFLRARETYDAATGQIRRVLPWHGDGEFTTTTCVYSEGVWDKADVGAKYDALDNDKATWVSWRHDLGVDFIPVIHRPNTPTGAEHYGSATLDHVAQLLDDLATLDSRAMEAASFLSGPAIGVSGVSVDNLVVAPRTAYGLGEKGRMDVLDLSSGVEQLYAGVDRLRDRLEANTSVPGDLVGRAGQAEKTATESLLRFTGFTQLIRSMRLPVAPKDELLLKMAQRLAQVAVKDNGEPVLPPGPTPVARIAYGPFLPTDLGGVIDAVGKLLSGEKAAISLETAVAMLADAGVPIDDVGEEVSRIRSTDFAGAAALGDAVNSDQAARDYLGLDPADAGAPPAPDLPPAGGGA